MPPADFAFTLEVAIKNAATGDTIAFKVDGARFECSQKTLKFAANAKYKIQLTSRPAAEFHHMHLAGSDLPLHCDDPKSGVYTTEWNTTGIDCSKKGDRNNIQLILQGPGGVLKRSLQTKFYPKGDSHSEWGHKLAAVILKCTIDGQGNIIVNDEEIR